MSDQQNKIRLPEFWLRGPVAGVPALLQPVAHALLQANVEMQEALQGFPSSSLWEKPSGAAAVGFHLRHIPGVLDRLFTYAEGNMLSAEQMGYLSAEEKPDEQVSVTALLDALEAAVHQSIERLKKIDETQLTAIRTVGRKRVPSTTIGLLFHAAEHTMRHAGQLLATVKIAFQAS